MSFWFILALVVLLIIRAFFDIRQKFTSPVDRIIMRKKREGYLFHGLDNNVKRFHAGRHGKLG